MLSLYCYFEQTALFFSHCGHKLAIALIYAIVEEKHRFFKNIYKSSQIAKFSVVYCFKIISIGLFGDV